MDLDSNIQAAADVVKFNVPVYDASATARNSPLEAARIRSSLWFTEDILMYASLIIGRCNSLYKDSFVGPTIHLHVYDIGKRTMP